jgi:CRISPR-associated protein Cmr2
MKKHHIALTIGPIHRTLQATRSTRAIWSASYMFSWIMKDLVKKLRDSKKVQFIAPFDGNTEGVDFCDDTKRGVGLFHDRIIVEADSTQINILNGFIVDTCHELAIKIKGCVEGYNVSDIELYLKDYLQFHVLEIEGTSDFTAISEYLDTVECQSLFVQKETEPFLVDFFEYLEKGKYNPFIEYEFSSNDTPDKRFPSTSEIATNDLSGKQGYNDALKALRQEETALFAKTQNERGEKKRKQKRQNDIDTQIVFYEKLSKSLLKELHQRHKYVAIVQADGDNMGGFIKAINRHYEANEPSLPQSNRFEVFSKQLMTFAYEATKEIAKFGAIPIYAGGDDLLFFTPLVGKKGESFLTLIEEIDKLFTTYILENEQLKIISRDKEPAMSYGVSVTYYKFPLGETHQRACELLFDEAKTGSKNNLAFEVQKHSGQQFGGVFSKTDKVSFDKFKDLVENRLKQDDSERFFSSITHKIQLHEGILRGIVKLDDFTERLESFFENNFNEPIHKTESAKTYLKRVRLFIESILKDKKTDKNLDDELLKIYGALRLVHFLQAPFKEEEER